MRSLLTFFWLLLLLGGTTWLLEALEQQTRVPSNIQKGFVPDYAMVDFVSTATDESGQITYQLQAHLLKHYPVINTELSQPYLVFYQNGQPLWYVHAKQARVSVDGSTIYMPGKVWLWRYAANASDWLHMVGRNMLVKPAEAYAESHASVKLLTSNGVTDSTGLKMFMRNQQVDLLSQVKGYYE